MLGLVPGLFAAKNFPSWKDSSMELSLPFLIFLPGMFIPWSFLSLELSDRKLCWIKKILNDETLKYYSEFHLQ